MEDILISGVLPAAIIGVVVGYGLGYFRGKTAPQRGAYYNASLQGYIDQLSEDGRAAVIAALAGGHKIEAIKAFRADTLLGLKEAKDSVEKMHRDLRQT